MLPVNTLWVCSGCRVNPCVCEPILHALVPASCACGKPARSRCGEGVAGLTMTLCREPVCGGEDGKPGSWCGEHRHRKGTMGFPDWAPQDVTYHGDDPGVPGIWPAIKAQFHMWFKSAPQLAQMARNEQMAFFDKNAPVPDFTFRVGKRVFKNYKVNDKKMIEVATP